ncbi:kinase-like domain-containing protein [Apiospora sp. TS-2023a]
MEIELALDPLPIESPEPSPAVHLRTLQIKVKSASGHKRNASLRLPDHVGEEGSRDFADPELRKQWIPYVIVEYDGFPASAQATFWTDSGMGWFTGDGFCFDIGPDASPSEATVSVFLRSVAATAEATRHVLLGSAKVNPFEPRWSDRQCGGGVALDGGATRVNLHIDLGEPEKPYLGDGARTVEAEYGGGDFVHVESCGGLHHGRATHKGGSCDHRSRSVQLTHPFVAPLAFNMESNGNMYLLSRMADGGHLFSHLQRERRFDVGKTAFYAAELVCAFQHLHDNWIVSSLRLENILIDPFGHISICNPGIYGLDTGAKQTHSIPNDRLVGSGGFGLRNDHWPAPFYDNDTKEKEQAIAAQDVRFNDNIPESAKDLIQRLLNRDPASRLGANGILEIKAHPFFHLVSWEEVPLKLSTPYRPVFDVPKVLKTNSPYIPDTFNMEQCWTGVREVSPQGFLWEGFDFPGAEKLWRIIGQTRSSVEDMEPKQVPGLAEDNDWDIEWDSEEKRLQFKNRSTDETRPVSREDKKNVPPADPPSDSCQPRQKDIIAALASVLQSGYSAKVVSQILAYGGVDLDTGILSRLEIPDTEFVTSPPSQIDSTSLTPLEWAVEHDRADLVRLFLDAGADANYTVYRTRGPALMKAVRKGNIPILQALYPTTARVSRTRALGLAAERGDHAATAALLELGCPCDFEEADRPRPFLNDECQYGGKPPQPLKPKHFFPALVLATWRGDAALVRLLLDHGADPDIGYHALQSRRHQRYMDPSPLHETPEFRCGRPAQLAMELGHREIVGLLLEAGADVGLAQPHWAVSLVEHIGFNNYCLGTGHLCPLVPRKVYLAVTAGLEEAVAVHTARAKR